MKRNAVTSQKAGAIGPYSHAVWSGELLYLSGQTPVDPTTGQLVLGGVGVQTVQCFQNLFSVLEEAGLTPQHVIKVNVYLVDMGDFADMNAVYAAQFEQPYPSRTTVGVASLPLGARIEIEMIARRGEHAN
jgi:2-iminobutanoate/2-iminopropanoate deaminase